MPKSPAIPLPRLTLQHKLPLAIGAVVLLTLSTSLALSYGALGRAAELRAREKLQSAVQEIAATAQAGMAARVQRNREITARRAIRSFLSAANPSAFDSAAALAALRPLRATRRPSLAVELWDKRGVPVLDAADPGPREHRPSVLSAEPHISPLFRSGDAVLGWVYVPVMEGPDVIGYVATQSRISGAAEAVQSLRRLTGEPADLYTRNADYTVWLRAPAEPWPAPESREHAARGVSYRRSGVGRTIAVEAPIAGTPWVAVIDVPASAVYARARATLAQIGSISLAMLLIGALIAWFSFKRMAAEIESARRELERRIAEAELARKESERANLAKSDFLAVMSHELRTPLNAIGGYAELLEMGVHGPVTEPQRDALIRIARNQAHLLALINDILNFVKVDAGRVNYSIEPVAVNEALGDLEVLIAPQLRAKHIGFAYRPSAPDLRIKADRDKLQQTVLNLLSNAVKFTPSGGSIVVETESTDAVVRIHVRDSGVGIPEDRLESIFDPFVQIDRARNRPVEGVGLGLAISRDLARGMGGELSVVSTVGAGSTFTITLPRALMGALQIA